MARIHFKSLNMQLDILSSILGKRTYKKEIVTIYTSMEVINLYDEPTGYQWSGWEDACLRRGVYVTHELISKKLKINIILEL